MVAFENRGAIVQEKKDAQAEGPRTESAAQAGSVAVLIPCYNEAVTIGKVVDDFRRALPGATVYVYDNNSSDGTGDIAREHGAVVRVERRQGKGNVVRQMMRDIDADYYLMVDGDDTYPAEAAPELLAPLVADEADMVVGDRLSNGTYGQENDRAFHGFGNDLVRALIKWIYGFEFSDVMTGYRAYNAVFAKTMPVLSPGFEIETELSIHAVDKRWRIAEVPIDYRDRPEGSESKLDTFSDGVKVLLMILSLFKDYRPLALFSWLALLFCVLGLVAGIPVIVEFASTGLVPRLPSALLAVALVFVGVISFSCGLILDTVVKGTRKQYELQVTEAYRKHGRR
ncbi:glycosyltransferase [Gordonibacter massiliensis]|uniref:Glycosyltransferase n=1 Tax=Gordonibacter massiliensis (ex Traore et al. 2017) TaxID=1841863 RepID=A0A842JLW9_9ACTN|nr:glycosyltransferase family 2 protein [Gordonibacter massiliensis (ex Traore et al. 2017)]MBC2890738.1 glycosyltransferase [Gordonibacter massiliensis (ex Traore et al. 2017)]